MTNERLRAAITDAGLSLQDFGDRIGVDPKTVERWISKDDRVPHRKHQMAAASILGKSQVFLWPATEADPRTHSATRAEFLDLYPNRGALPSSMWVELIDGARESIDLLAFAGSFLNDSIPDFRTRITERAKAGVRVRLLFGDPESDAVKLRGEEERIGESMTDRCRLTWKYLTPLLTAHTGIQARRHRCTLYASLFRFDDTLLANTHVYGTAASESPVLHINRIPGGRLFSHYMDSFERTWASAEPI